MLRLILQRVGLTSVLLTGFVTAGLLFDSGTTSAFAQEISAENRSSEAKVAENPVSPNPPLDRAPAVRQIKRLDPGWPFYSFSRKRSSRSW